MFRRWAVFKDVCWLFTFKIQTIFDPEHFFLKLFRVSFTNGSSTGLSQTDGWDVLGWPTCKWLIFWWFLFFCSWSFISSAVRDCWKHYLLQESWNASGSQRAVKQTLECLGKLRSKMLWSKFELYFPQIFYNLFRSADMRLKQKGVENWKSCTRRIDASLKMMLSGLCDCRACCKITKVGWGKDYVSFQV